MPLTTLVVGYSGRTRYLAAAEAVAAVGDVVLLRDDKRRLGRDLAAPGRPAAAAAAAASARSRSIGPGTLDARGKTFAVLGRTNDYAWLMVGPTSARTNGDINVVALDGGAPVPGAAPPAFTASGRVLDGPPRRTDRLLRTGGEGRVHRRRRAPARHRGLPGLTARA